MSAEARYDDARVSPLRDDRMADGQRQRVRDDVGETPEPSVGQQDNLGWVVVD